MRFPGQYEDVETGLHYNYYRYYEPTIGRYLRADPIGLTGGINLYSHVKNKPIIHSDRTGLFCWECLDDPDAWEEAIVEGQGPLTDEIYLGDIYCGTISMSVSVCADAAAIGAAVTTALSGGVATPITGQIAVSAKVISITNGLVSLYVCGPKLSTVTSTVGTAVPGWWGVAVSTIDAALSALGN